MNVRLGFARIARVTAVLYVLTASVVVGGEVKSMMADRSARLKAEDRRYGWPDGPTYVVRHPSEAESQRIVDDYINYHIGRATGDGTDAKPYRVVTMYDQPTPTLGQIGGSAVKLCFWWALAYAAMWTAFRGIRWIALGFMEKTA